MSEELSSEEHAQWKAPGARAETPGSKKESNEERDARVEGQQRERIGKMTDEQLIAFISGDYTREAEPDPDSDLHFNLAAAEEKNAVADVIKTIVGEELRRRLGGKKSESVS